MILSGRSPDSPDGTSAVRSADGVEVTVMSSQLPSLDRTLIPQALTDRLVDYAGTFPPASLPFDDALQDFAALASGEAGRMRRGLAWPARELERLADLGPVYVAAIGSDEPNWDEARRRDALALEAAPENVEFLSYECRLPVGADAGALRGFSATRVLLELLPGDEEGLSRLAEEVEWAGAKLRTGGAAIPSPAVLAGFLHTCLALEIPFKLTAGLHSPISHNGEFGFLSVLVAAARGLADDLTVSEIQALLIAPALPTITSQEAEDVRDLFLAIGSCDLAAMAQVLA
ncbi:MAG: hypothetical protein C4320_09795 [Armatimonadota bacterium]